MPKINIYVPDEMKARMDEAEKSANWSAVAQRAFELELKHLESIKEIKSMTDVIERLRVSKQKKAEELEKAGRRSGVKWAKKHAKYDELKRAANINTSNLHEAYVDDVDDVNRTWVARQILADPELDAGSWETQNMAIAELFEVEEDMVESVVTTEFIEGFLEGAGDVWDQVKDEL
jgi:hypothetical protein